MTTDAHGMRILIACEHASAEFGGEAALPLHYFRVLRARGADVWLLAHARTRDELQRLFPGETRLRFVEDTRLNRAMWCISRRLPAQIAYVTTGFVSRFATQLAERRVVRQLVRDEGIDVVHQPMPVSPREPSMLFGFGVPVIIGPMNGGMDYPPAFRRRRGLAERVLLGLGRASAVLLNVLVPGKRRAEMLLVANPRTRDALPGVRPRVLEMVENGVDLTLWHADAPAPSDTPATAPLTTYAFVGRLVDWKAVDLLLHAFQRALRDTPMVLEVIGDGVARPALERLAAELGIVAAHEAAPGVRFRGRMPQAECARRLQAADALVLPSLLECGGAVVLEAMAMGKPVIATAWGGPLDYLDERCGVLVPPTGREALVQGLAEAMLRLAASPELRGEMGRHGREKVRRDHDWEVKVDRMVAVYRHALRRGSPSESRWPVEVS